MADRARRRRREKFICCNADEGDSGTFADRMLMEGDPFLLIEGMTIAGLAVGAEAGFLYIRSEYPDAVASMTTAVEIAELTGLARAVGARQRAVASTSRCASVRAPTSAAKRPRCSRASRAAGARSGRSRRCLRIVGALRQADGDQQRPVASPSVPAILADGAEAYAALGVGRSRGTQVFQLAGNIARGGIVELDFGVSLGELVEDFGGGTMSGRPVRAVQVGGPLGAYVPASGLELPMDYEAFAAVGAMVGHGGIVVFDDTVDMAQQARFAMEFCAEESCGKCTPCRIGSVRGVEVIDKIIAGVDRDANLALLEDLCRADDRRVAVRDGRAHADAGAERARAFP